MVDGGLETVWMVDMRLSLLEIKLVKMGGFVRSCVCGIIYYQLQTHYQRNKGW